MSNGSAAVAGPGRSHLEALRRLAEHLASDLDEAEVVRVLLDAISVALGAPFGRGVLVEAGGLTIVARLGDEQAVPATHLPTWVAPAGEAIRTGALVVVPDLLADPRFAGEPLLFGSSRARAGLAVPLVYAERALGALSVGFDAPRSFPPDDLELVSGLASAGAVALERASLARQERAARHMVDTVLAQAPLGIGVIDVHGRTLLHNEALDAIWRRSDFSRSMDDFAQWQGFHPDGRPYDAGEWPGVRCLAGESIMDEEIDIIRPDGTRAVISVRAEPVRDASGAIIGGVVAVMDITHRRELEAMRMAFIDVLSHELRTPVTSIFGLAKVLAARWRTLPDHVRGELIDDIASESDRLQGLIEDLVVVAKVERGVDLAASEPVLIQHRLRSVASAVAAEWPARTFVIDVPDGVPPAAGDDGYMEQVLRNLLGNAAKYGRSQVHARVTFDDAWVEVVVSDDGPGLEPGDVDRVFDLFYRSPAAVVAPGAGIGLFVARRLVTAMGGRLSAENLPGGGAAFRLALRRFPVAEIGPE